MNEHIDCALEGTNSIGRLLATVWKATQALKLGHDKEGLVKESLLRIGAELKVLGQIFETIAKNLTDGKKKHVGLSDRCSRDL